MKTFETPKIEVISFQVLDVISTSGDDFPLLPVNEEDQFAIVDIG